MKLNMKVNTFTWIIILSGQYGVHIKWNDEHIPNSPFKVTVSPDGGSARQVTIHAFKDRGLAVSNPYDKWASTSMS